MRKSAIIAAALLLAACGRNAPVEPTVAVVPLPQSLEQFSGFCTCAPDKAQTSINSSLGAEEYVLDTRGSRIKIEAGSEAGVFYARQTLSQIASQGGEAGIPRVLIKDKPEFGYRGAHLDCCRHFWTVDEVKKFIDICAVHKLNVFHWHLTEDQGWRFESKKYPRLTEVGAWRDGTLVGHATKEFSPDNVFDGIRYGGFYTQEEMKDVVAYAAERFITVIPEIEMPGHATAALAAYPELGCTGGPYKVIGEWGVFPDIFCVGKPGTLQFLKDVLDEVCEVFPSEYIHIGGDEAPRDRWCHCPDCQALKKQMGYGSEAQLQSWLVNEVEKYLNSKGRKIIGWDEILEGGVSQTATVMSWRGPQGGKTAAALGNDVIMAPTTNFYFDFYQTGDPEKNGESLSIGGHLNLRQVYRFDPYEDLDDSVKAHIRGIQANMWTEYVPTFDGVEFRELPRMAALCEVAWNASGRTSYEDFAGRVAAALVPVYEAEGWNYADFAFRNPPVD